VLFCDLRGFTELCEGMEPAEVRRMLDLYYAAVSDTVLRYGGTVVQYVGDEVFSIFGAPDAQPDHAARALACAAQLLDEMPDLQRRLRDSGMPKIGYGVGVHTGALIAASVGTDRRRQYGVVGQTVNIGARLCARAGVGVALVSDATRAAASAHDDDLRSRGPINLAGVTTPVEAFELTNGQAPESVLAQLR
jgi:adenylate cyclase